MDSYRPATDWTTDELWCNSQREEGVFQHSPAPRQALGPTQPPIQRVLEGF